MSSCDGPSQASHESIAELPAAGCYSHLQGPVSRELVLESDDAGSVAEAVEVLLRSSTSRCLRREGTREQPSTDLLPLAVICLPNDVIGLLVSPLMLPTRVLRALPPTIAQTLRSPPSPEAEITVRGWVALVQPKKHFSFVKLSDGSSREPLQIFVDGGKESGGLRRCGQDVQSSCQRRPSSPPPHLPSRPAASSRSSRGARRSSSRASSCPHLAALRVTSSRRRR